MADHKVWIREEILKMWPQAEGELRGFQSHLERRAGITAAQLSMALQLAGEEFKRLLTETCERCKCKADALRFVDEIIDRFEVRRVKACPKCATEIRKENSSFSN